MKQKVITMGWLLLPLLGVLLAASPVRAQTPVTLNTGAINGLGTYYFDFQLLDGNGTGDGNSMAILSSLSLTGGALGAALPNTGAVTGDPTALAGLTLTDSDPGGVAEYKQAFTVTNATSLLTFNVGLATTASLDSPISDQFNFLILESDGLTPLPTNGPVGVELLSSSFDSLTPALMGFATTSDSPVALDAPVIGGPSTAIPEPSAAALLALGLPLIAWISGRRGRSA